jgi:hypothetical protein
MKMQQNGYKKIVKELYVTDEKQAANREFAVMVVYQQ